MPLGRTARKVHFWFSRTAPVTVDFKYCTAASGRGLLRSLWWRLLTRRQTLGKVDSKTRQRLWEVAFGFSFARVNFAGRIPILALKFLAQWGTSRYRLASLLTVSPVLNYDSNRLKVRRCYFHSFFTDFKFLRLVERFDCTKAIAVRQGLWPISQYDELWSVKSNSKQWLS